MCVKKLRAAIQVPPRIKGLIWSPRTGPFNRNNRKINTNIGINMEPCMVSDYKIENITIVE